MRISRILLKLVANQKFFARKDFILVDNTFNNEAELTDMFTLFEYMQSKPEYKDKSYYIINRKNVQYREIAAKYPNNIIAVKHGRLNLKLLYRLIFAKYWLDSFQVISAFDPKAYIANGAITTIYTQHGINYFKPGYWGNATISPKYFNKIVFSNKQEQEIFSHYYGYNEKNVIMAGLPRWDLIKKKSADKIVFIYFTSREYLWQLQCEDIRKTAYYRNIEKLLTSKAMQKLVNKYGLKIYAGVHHEMVRNISTNEALRHINFVEDKDIGMVKQKASLLITDFSSMCFDFMTKDKPVVFFRIDAGDKLCKTSLDSYKNDVNVEKKNSELYNIFYKQTDVIRAVEKYIKNGFKLEPEYKNINKKFFTYRSNICGHLIENILKSPLNIANENYPSDLSFLEPIKFNRKTEFSQFFIQGIGKREDWGQWSIGKESVIAFKLPKKTALEVVFDCCAFVNSKHKKLYADVCVGETKKAAWLFERKKDKGLRKIIINPKDLDKDNICCLFFNIHNPTSMKKLGLGTDTRMLGIGFKSVKFVEIKRIV